MPQSLQITWISALEQFNRSGVKGYLEVIATGCQRGPV